MCCEDTRSFVSCPVGHHTCGGCFDRLTRDFNFSDREKCFKIKDIVAPDLHSWPFMCYNCLDESVCNLYPIGACMSVMSSDCTRILFNTLRKFQLDEGGNPKHIASDPNEVETVRAMVSLLFEPTRCPECFTPFVHAGGCMSMKCSGRPGVLCQACFCLWCLRVPNTVRLLGPNATARERSDACHSHIFHCPMAPPGSGTPGKSRLFPTEHEDSSDWIIAWHQLKTIEKALKFLRDFVAPNIASAVMAAPDIAMKFAGATACVEDRLKKFPQDSALLQLPRLMHPDLQERVERFEVEDDSDDSSDVDFIPAGRMRMQLPAPVDQRHDVDDDDDNDDENDFEIGRPRPRPPPAERHEIWQRFEGMVQFVMDSCAVNRRAATDALFSNDRNPVRAIEFLLQ